MGDKLPSSAASGNYAGDNIAIEKWDLQKQAWQRDRAVQGNKVLDVLRYTESGGDPVARLPPDYTPVAGLTDLDTYVDSELKRYERKWGGLIEEANVVFILYDVPGTASKQDMIEYDDNRYRVLESDVEPQSGRTELIAALDRSSV